MKLKVNSEGEITCVLNWLKVGEKTITYPEKIPGLAGVSAMIGIMPVDRAEMRNREVITKGSLSEILDDWGGVYVRHKDFRVYPYGEPGNDWLNIDRDRGIRRTALSEILQPFAAKLRGVNPQRALLSLLSSKSYIGEIENGGTCRPIQPKASREGFVGEAGITPLRNASRPTALLRLKAGIQSVFIIVPDLDGRPLALAPSRCTAIKRSERLT